MCMYIFTPRANKNIIYFMKICYNYDEEVTIMPLDNIIAQKLVEKIMDNLGYNINIMDENGFIIGSGEKDRIGKVHIGALEVLESGKTLSHFKSTNTKDKSSKPGINIPLYLSGNIIGVLGVTGDPDEVLKISTIVKLLAEMLLEQEVHSDKKIVNQTSKNTYMYRIISKDNENYINSINSWAEENGYSFQNIERLVCLIIFKNDNELNEYKTQEYIISKIQSMNCFLKEDLISYFGNKQLILFKSLHSKKEKQIIIDFFTTLKKSLKDELELRILCGGTAFNMAEMHNSYEQAKFLSNWYQCQKNDLYFIDEYILDFFITNNDTSDLYMICRKIINKINNNINLKDTIIAMASSNMSLNKTSKQLSIHRNTVVYRMQKIKTVLGLDPLHNQTDRVKILIISILLQKEKKSLKP